MSYKIRTALPSDGAALAAIYAPYTETAITYEYPAPTAEEFSARIAAISAHYPFIVCESDGRALGYAYSHRDRERAAYDWDTELSIYFDRAETGRGLGRPLYSALLDLLRLQGYVNIYGTVSAPNPASERLHEKMCIRDRSSPLSGAGRSRRPCCPSESTWTRTRRSDARRRSR